MCRALTTHTLHCSTFTSPRRVPCTPHHDTLAVLVRKIATIFALISHTLCAHSFKHHCHARHTVPPLPCHSRVVAPISRALITPAGTTTPSCFVGASGVGPLEHQRHTRHSREQEGSRTRTQDRKGPAHLFSNIAIRPTEQHSVTTDYRPRLLSWPNC